jgi:hypothetical protein
MYALSLLKHFVVVVVAVVVLRKFGGPQQWLAPCGKDVPRVSRTMDVCILEKESHRQTKMIT